VWYSSDLEFDHEFISELRGFLLQCLRRLNNGQGCTISQVLATVEEKKVSKVKLDEDDVEQLMGTLVFDHLVEITESVDGKQVYTAARKIHTACEFKWWSDAVAPDFHFRTIKFEDGVVLDAHEPHYHTA
jgi:DNA-directed RNA polymerase III subunit RPC6